MSPPKDLTSAQERRIWQLLVEFERHSGQETTGGFHIFHHEPRRSGWKEWVSRVKSALAEFAVLGEPQLRADRLLVNVWRTNRQDLEVRQLRAELAEARDTLSRLAHGAGISGGAALAPATDDQLRSAVRAVLDATTKVFGQNRIQSIEVAEESDPEIAARHRVSVDLKVGDALSPQALAEARGQFFKALASALPRVVSGKVRVVLQLVP